MKLLLASLIASAAVASGVVLEADATYAKRGLPEGWAALSRSKATQGIRLTFAVKQTNLGGLEEALMAVSDPRSKRYGHHLSNDEVHDLVRPDKRHAAAVHAFLTMHGLVGVPATPNGDMLHVDVTVEQAEKLLKAEYHELEHASTGLKMHRTLSYELPTEVAAAVDFVAPTVHVPALGSRTRVKFDDKAPPSFGNSPAQLRKLYSVGSTEGKAADNKMAVTAFLEQYYSVDDLHQFWSQFCDGITCGQGDPTTVGDAIEGRAGVESMLDIQTITGVAGNVHAEFWGFSGRSPDNKENEPFLDWLVKMSNTTDADIPKVFSTSYGEDENSWSLAAAQRLNVEFQKAGARGISLLYASGDEGTNCKDDVYVPEGPGSSPYVTAVGGTQGSSTETAIGLSSGGFSGYWLMPDYQKDAVNKYLSSAKDLPPASMGYNVSGRAYPDIAAQASDFTVIAGGQVLPGVAGTSCATPTVGGIIALLNDARLQQGKPPLGFLNPWLYQNAEGWNDITSGSSEGCLFDEGWPAAVGWDAVTGLGTPNYAKLVDLMP